MPDASMSGQHAGTQAAQLWEELKEAKREIERLRNGIRSAVAKLFVAGNGHKATRLILVQESPGMNAVVSNALDLGGWAEECVVDLFAGLLRKEKP